MGNQNVTCPTLAALRMVHAVRDRSTGRICRAEPWGGLPVSLAMCMVRWFGNVGELGSISVRTLLPADTEGQGPATVYMVRDAGVRGVYVVEYADATYDLDGALRAGAQRLTAHWRTGAVSIRVEAYVDALEVMRSVDERLFNRLAPAAGRWCVRRRLERGAAEPEDICQLFTAYMAPWTSDAPLQAGMVIAMAWMQGMDALLDLRAIIPLLEEGARQQLRRDEAQLCLSTWVTVLLERLLSLRPHACAPPNLVRCVRAGLAEIDELFGLASCGLRSVYDPLLADLASVAQGINVAIPAPPAFPLEDHHPDGTDDARLVLWLSVRVPRIGLALRDLLDETKAPVERWVEARALLQHLVHDAVPRDRTHRWALDLPWNRVVHCIIRVLESAGPLLDEQPSQSPVLLTIVDALLRTLGQQLQMVLWSPRHGTLLFHH